MRFTIEDVTIGEWECSIRVLVDDRREPMWVSFWAYNGMRGTAITVTDLDCAQFGGTYGNAADEVKVEIDRWMRTNCCTHEQAEALRSKQRAKSRFLEAAASSRNNEDSLDCDWKND